MVLALGGESGEGEGGRCGGGGEGGLEWQRGRAGGDVGGDDAIAGEGAGVESEGNALVRAPLTVVMAAGAFWVRGPVLTPAPEEMEIFPLLMNDEREAESWRPTMMEPLLVSVLPLTVRPAFSARMALVESMVRLPSGKLTLLKK